jgi:hypothetical protein
MKDKKKVVKTKSRFGQKILIGSLVNFLILVILAQGDIIIAGGMILFGFICTLGIATGPWILVAWLLGSIVFLFGDLFTENKEGEDGVSTAQNSTEQILDNYILNSKRNGYNRQFIENSLLAKGWPRHFIQDAIKRNY